MKNLKKALSMVLASAMLFGMMVVGTGAAHADVTAEHNKEAIEVVSAVGIMGANEEFNPDAKITRNEMAVVMVNMLGLDTDDYAGASNFTDVPAWAADYVDACYANGIVSGVSATEFNGGANVTAAEAALMVMKALGYFQYASDFEADWLLATVKQASKIDLLKDIDAKATAQLTRNEVAQLALNALKANMVEPKENGIGVDANGKIVSKYEYAKVTATDGTADEIDGTNASVEGITCDYVQLGEELYDNKLELNTGLDDAAGRPAHEWEYKNEVIGTYADTADYVVVVSGTKNNELSEILESIDEDLVADGSCFDVLNGVDGAVSGTYVVGDVVELFNTNSTVDDDIDEVIVTRYTTDVIETVDTDVTAADAKKGVSAYITFETAGLYKDTEIVGFDAKTYVEDAVVAVAINGNDEFIGSYIPETVEGAISAFTSTTYTLSGTKYTMVGAIGGDDEISGTVDFDEGVYKLYLDTNGYVLRTEVVEGTVTLDDVVYVTLTWAEGAKKYGADEYKFYAQVVDMDGKVSELEITAEQFAGLTKVETPDVADIATYVEKDLTSEYGFVDSADVSITAGKTYYTQASADAITAEVLYSFETNSKGVSTLTAWTGDDELTAIVDEAHLTEGNTLKSSSTSVTLQANKYYLNASTKYIVVEANGEDIDVTVKTGGIAYTLGADADATVIYDTVNGSKIAAYVIIPTGEYTSAAEGDYIYVTDASDFDNVDGGKKLTVYKMDGTTMDIVVEAGWADVDNKFYSYSIDADGYYTLAAAGNDVHEAQVYTNYIGTKLNSTYLADADAEKAIFVDLHSKTEIGEYTKAVNSLAAMQAATEKGFIVEFDVLQAAANDADAKVTIIFVTEVALPDFTVTVNKQQTNNQLQIYMTFVDNAAFEVGDCRIILKDAEGARVAEAASLTGGEIDDSCVTEASRSWSCGFRVGGPESANWSGCRNIADLDEAVSAEIYLYGVKAWTGAATMFVAAQ